jgi:hypothetical protein
MDHNEPVASPACSVKINGMLGGYANLFLR